MARFATYEGLDDPPLLDGDSAFVGVNMRLDPSQLPAGYVSKAVNMRFNRGVAEPRLGVRKVPWTNRSDSGITTTTIPFTNVHGVATFRDGNGVTWIIIAAEGKVFKTAECLSANIVPMPSTVTLTGRVTFTQCNNQLIMFRGENAPELVLEDLDEGFTIIAQKPNEITGLDTENPDDGTFEIPPASSGEWIGNRLFIPYQRDLLAISDYLNPTRYAGVRAQGRINQGSSDALVRFFQFTDNAGIAFKEKSVFVVNNLKLDLSEMTLDLLTDQYGCVAARSVAQAGNDILFLSERGVVSIRQTELNKLQSVDLPLSDPIQPLIDRINWSYVSGAAGVYHNNRYYLAVPLDKAEVLGKDIMPVARPIGSSPAFIFTLKPGVTYKWTKGPADTSLSVDFGPTLTETGTFTVPVPPPELVATGVIGLCSCTIVYNGSFFDPDGGSNGPTSKLQRVWSGVNNAVLVYDFLNQAWSGYDEGSAINIFDWAKSTFGGVQRLFALGNDGFLSLYEEGFQDDEADPTRYSALELYATYDPESSSGTVFQINGGTTLQINTAQAVNTGVDNWGADIDFATGRKNLFHCVNNVGGYDQTGATHWLAPNCNVTLRPNGATRWESSDFTEITLTFPPGFWYGLAGFWTTYEVIWPTAILTELVTRGYKCTTDGRKRFLASTVVLSSWYPQYSVNVLVDGVNESRAVATDKTKSQTRYFQPFDAPDWDRLSATQDYLAPYREDYALVMLTSTGADYIREGVSGINPDLHQEYTENYRVNAEGRYCRVQILGARGRVEVRGVAVEAQPGRRRMGALA